ncbi:MAG TPA: YggT family protein [Steroidobacteraceae bacterium]|nr:YggT family protein [Steroidobacteraceae bacterium]
MQGILYIFDTLATLYNYALLLRLIMQLSRADFRNPVSRGIVQLTDPVIRPLRRVLPPAGRIDTASVVAVLLFAAVKLWLLQALAGYAAIMPFALLRATLLEVAHLVLKTYFFSIILNAILSFVAPGNYSPAQSLLASICDPVLNPIRRVIPSIAGLDLSPLWALIAIQALLIVLPVA